jgi:O-methyltransferase
MPKSRKPTIARTLTQIAQKAARGAGFELRSTKELRAYEPGIRHAEVFPEATYSPWLSDAEFNGIYEAVKENTLVDRYRCYELWQLVGEAAKLPGGDLIEVGVWRGGTGAIIAQRARMAGIRNPVYLCDTFQGVVKAGAKDAFYTGGEHADTSQEAVVTLMDRLGLEGVKVLKGIFPDDSRQLVEDRTFRFCHIDVDVYESARHVAEWIWPRLVPHGAIVYDDYGFRTCVGVTRFVNEERAKPDRMVIHNLNGHAIVLKIA